MYTSSFSSDSTSSESDEEGPITFGNERRPPVSSRNKKLAATSMSDLERRRRNVPISKRMRPSRGSVLTPMGANNANLSERPDRAQST